jgi:hypothetical protein
LDSAGSLILPFNNVPIIPAPSQNRFAISFDTSGIDRLEREEVSERKALIAGLKTLGAIQVTGMNVSESMSIQGDHRAHRLTLLEELTGEFKPLQQPNTLLADVACAYHARQRSVTLGDDGCWIALKNRQNISDSMAAESQRWHQDREKWFLATYKELREAYAPIFKEWRHQRPRSTAFMIRFFIERGPQYWDLLLIPIYERQTGYQPSHLEFERFLNRVPAWKMFWLARIYALYRRSVRVNSYGKRNAGLNDLDSAIYLPFCDWFVTDDARQRRALRVVNAANPKRTEIISYDSMRSRLFGSCSIPSIIA